MTRVRTFALLAAVALAATVSLSAQQPPARPASGVGTASAEVGGTWVKTDKTTTYQGGKWMDITYGRPHLRGRSSIFGSGADYGKAILAGAPIWRAGANVATRLKTDVAIMIGNTHIQPGEYTVYIDAKENNWTFVLSSWAIQTTFDPKNKAALWGAYGYTADKDVVRAPMTLSTLPSSVDQLTWSFVDITDKGGKLAIMWDTTMAVVPFTLM
ncbi:MAG: DUF2911 domain-containing protein [Acidobacteria bacterium]|nr:DUF2911 domain-containing protein [Acidobacteriota bacterium]